MNVDSTVYVAAVFILHCMSIVCRVPDTVVPVGSEQDMEGDQDVD